MGKRLHVGNLSFETTTESLTTAFAQDGRSVESVSIVMDRDSGKSRGFAFIEMGSDGDAQGAVKALHGSEVDGRALRVSEAEGRKSPFGGTLGGGEGRR
jgi:cold-inducible RNA-binding protein